MVAVFLTQWSCAFFSTIRFWPSAAPRLPAGQSTTLTNGADRGTIMNMNRLKISGRTIVFLLSTVYLIGLGVLAVAYVEEWITPRHEIGSLPTPVLWFGALGAVLLSLTGVFDHRGDWDNGFLPWHISRPLVGAAVAVIAVLIVIAGILATGTQPGAEATGTEPAAGATTANTTKNIFYFLVAFIVGYREETFRLLIKRLADVILIPGTTTEQTTIKKPATAGEPETEITTTVRSGETVRGEPQVQ